MALPAHGTKVITMDKKKKELTSWELYQQERLPSIRTWLFGAAGLFAFAFSLYLGTSTNCDAAMVGNKQDSSSNTEEFLTPEEREQRRQAQAQAAEKRAQNFQQGGGGERVKAAAARRDSAEKKAIAEGRGPNSRNNMQWQV